MLKLQGAYHIQVKDLALVFEKKSATEQFLSRFGLGYVKFFCIKYNKPATWAYCISSWAELDVYRNINMIIAN